MVLKCTHNLCFEEKFQNIPTEIFFSAVRKICTSHGCVFVKYSDKYVPYNQCMQDAKTAVTH